MNNRQVKRGMLVSVALVAMCSGVLCVAPAAFADDLQTAPTDLAGYQDFVQEIIATDPAVTSVGQDGNGNIVVSSDDNSLAPSTYEELDAYDNIVFEDRPAMQAMALNDVVGGAGYAFDRESVCSFGFSGWSATGEPAIITAGHCGVTGSNIELTLPSGDDAPYYPGGVSEDGAFITQPVGVMGFSQWGGVSGTEGGNGDFDSTDIAVIDVQNPDLRLLPAVTDWTTWASEDLSLSTIPVTAVGTVEVGDAVVGSGRTTGMTSGYVHNVGSATVLESHAWSRVCEEVEPVLLNCRWVYGFYASAVSLPGDSGGAFLRGGTAVGVLSGYGEFADGEGYSFVTDLQNGLRLTPGYTVMLDLAEPVVTSATTVAPGSVVRGTGGAGLTLVVTPADADAFDVLIAGDGTWSFVAPVTAGPVSYGLQIKDAGFNRSESVPLSLTVDQQQFVQPAFSAPVNGATVAGPTVTFTGVSEPSAQIALSGDVTADFTANAEGNWSFTTELDYGSVSVTATQTVSGYTASSTIQFAVAPVAPVLMSPADGAVLVDVPSEVTGTGLPGAEVSVTLNGELLPEVMIPMMRAVAATPVAWSVPLPGDLGAGVHELVVTQTVDGFVSVGAHSVFTIAGAPVTPDDASALTNTGAESAINVVPVLVAGGLMVLACAILVTSRKQRRQN